MANRLKTMFSGDSLAARVTKGGVSIAVASGVEQAVRFGRNVLLARMLLPDAFGVVALVLTFTMLLDSLSQVGIREAVIQSPDASDPTYLNGAWFLSLARGGLLTAAGVALAPLAAMFFGKTDLVPMLRVASLAFLFQGAVSAKAYVALKTLKTARWAMVQQIGGLVGVMSSIVLCLIWRNAWGLVLGSVIEALSCTLISFLAFPFVPRWRFDRELLSSVLRYARRMAGIPILTYLYLQVDVFVVGRTQTVESVGLYAMAAAMARVPDMLVSRFATPVIVPAFSSLQGDAEAIGRSLGAVIRGVGILAVPLVVAGLLYGDIVMGFVYPDNYAAVGLVFGVLLCASALRNLTVPFASVCLATGRADALRKVTAVRAVFALAIVVPATRWMGMTGAALSVMVSSLVAYFLQWNEIRSVVGPGAAGAAGKIMVGVLFALPTAAMYPLVMAAKHVGEGVSVVAVALSVLASYIAYGVYVFIRRSIAPPTPAGG